MDDARLAVRVIDPEEEAERIEPLMADADERTPEVLELYGGLHPVTFGHCGYPGLCVRGTARPSASGAPSSCADQSILTASTSCSRAISPPPRCTSGWATWLRHDVVAEELPEGAFDLVHGRAVLTHLPARALALDRMVAALRPGGWLLIEDVDYVSAVVDPAVGADAAELFATVWGAVERLWAPLGVNPRFGRQLYGAVLARGLTDVGAEGRLSMARPGSAMTSVARLTPEQLRERMVAAGLLTNRELDDYAALLDRPDFVWMDFMMMAVWGRRPVA